MAAETTAEAHRGCDDDLCDDLRDDDLRDDDLRDDNPRSSSTRQLRALLEGMREISRGLKHPGFATLQDVHAELLRLARCSDMTAAGWFTIADNLRFATAGELRRFATSIATRTRAEALNTRQDAATFVMRVLRKSNVFERLLPLHSQQSELQELSRRALNSSSTMMSSIHAREAAETVQFLTRVLAPEWRGLLARETADLLGEFCLRGRLPAIFLDERREEWLRFFRNEGAQVLRILVDNAVFHVHMHRGPYEDFPDVLNTAMEQAVRKSAHEDGPARFGEWLARVGTLLSPSSTTPANPEQTTLMESLNAAAARFPLCSLDAVSLELFARTLAAHYLRYAAPSWSLPHVLELSYEIARHYGTITALMGPSTTQKRLLAEATRGALPAAQALEAYLVSLTYRWPPLYAPLPSCLKFFRWDSVAGAAPRTHLCRLRDALFARRLLLAVWSRGENRGGRGMMIHDRSPRRQLPPQRAPQTGAGGATNDGVHGDGDGGRGGIRDTWTRLSRSAMLAVLEQLPP